MKVSNYTLFLDRLVVEAEIGIHDFERGQPQRVAISISVDISPDRLPGTDDIAATFDYDWVRLQVLELVRGRRFELQETLAKGIVDILASRPEIVRITVETSKPDVYGDVDTVGCRLQAHR